MAVYTIRSNLSSAIFPFATELWGRSIILHQQDQNYDSATINAPGVVIDKGIPQAFYMHNVVPTIQGFQSIGYAVFVPAIIPGATDFDHVYDIQTASGGRFLFVPAAGKNYIFDANVGVWQSVSPLTPGSVPLNVQVTTAFVHGETYIFYANFGCFKYDPVLIQMTAVTLIALSIPTTLGICAANNYMIAYNTLAIAWSSTTNPLDFTPSLITGAGGGGVNEAKGNIVACLNLSGGFLIYCDKNVVFAKYSGNILFPFVTKEVPGSGGISDIHKVSFATNLSSHVAYTSAGLQQIGPANADDIYNEISDFIAAKIFEDFDETTNFFSSSYLSIQLFINVVVVAERFLIISYGTTLNIYTHAIVYDLSLKRYGKFKITHVDAFEWNFPNLAGFLTYGKLSSTLYSDLSTTTYSQLGTNVNPPKTFKQNVCFLQQDGTVQSVVFDISEATGSGVLVIGKFQLSRASLVQHEGLDIDTVNPSNNLNVYLLTSLDGKTLSAPITMFNDHIAPKMRSYLKQRGCLNFSYLFKGQFDLTSLITTITIGGNTD